MSTITISREKILMHDVDCYAYIVSKDEHDMIDDDIAAVCPEIQYAVKKQKFNAALGDSVITSFIHQDRIRYCILVGMGAVSQNDQFKNINQYRRAIGSVIKQAQSLKIESIALAVKSFDDRIKELEIVQEVTVMSTIAQYHFDDFITDVHRKHSPISLTCVVNTSQDDAKKAVEKGLIVARAVNQARHWVDMPPTQLTPQDLVLKAADVAKRNSLKMTVFHEQDVIKMGMGGLAAVSRGSDVDCALIILEHRAKNPDAPTLCFVGKGITFDSGGLSLKPADFMETMKEDMSGAAAVLSGIDALSQLDCPINIVAIAPTSENLPSGKATKPGDIVKFYNGKTAEIKNTDAEGRLILADALSYAVKHYKPDAMVDLATLTGACSRALGPFYSGLFTENELIKEKLMKAGVKSGDQLWQLPMGDDYKKAISSTVADICNIGNSKVSAGASTAAHFLQNFVDDTVWAHIDIAGTAFDVPYISYYQSGATGVGVRLLIELAMDW